MEKHAQLKHAVFLCTLILALPPTAWPRVIYVATSGSADFATIQAAIDDANDGDTVLVAPGTYIGDGNRDIDFKGKAITVKSEAGPKSCIIQCGGRYPYSAPYVWIAPEYHRGFYFHCREDANSVVQGFTVAQGYMGPDDGGAIYCDQSSPTIRDCVITGNMARNGGGIASYRSDIRVECCLIVKNTTSWTSHDCGGGVFLCFGNAHVRNCLIAGNTASYRGGGIYCRGSHRIANCTVTGNRTQARGRGQGGGITFGPDGDDLSYLYNSIVWGNWADYGGNDIEIGETSILFPMRLRVSYSLVGEDANDIYDPFARISGQWLRTNPLFVNDGCWDSNETPDKLSGDFWVDGDYHLKSQAGRWDPESQSWMKDDITSPCIDAGDPNSPIGLEPFPNGGRINMGAYGGTGEASKSYFGEPICTEIIPGDVNGDCRVDWTDLSILASHWLEDHSPHGLAATTFTFVTGDSTITAYCGRGGMRIYHIEGQFRLTIDPVLHKAAFDQVDAELDKQIRFSEQYGAEDIVTKDLDTVFHLTQSISTGVKAAGADFIFRKNVPSFPGADIRITVAFHRDTISMTGMFSDTVCDGCWYDLSATAVPLDDSRSPQSLTRMLEMIISGDIDNDWRVDFVDLTQMARQWRTRCTQPRR